MIDLFCISVFYVKIIIMNLSYKNRKITLKDFFLKKSKNFIFPIAILKNCGGKYLKKSCGVRNIALEEVKFEIKN